MDSRESATLVALAKDTNRVGGVAHNLRYYPLCVQAKALIESWARSDRVRTGAWRIFCRDCADVSDGLELAAGIETWRRIARGVRHRHVHWLDLIQWITGQKVEELCADLATVVPVRHKPRGHVESFSSAKDVPTDEDAD